MQASATTMESSMGVPQRAKNKTSSNTTPWHIYLGMLSNKDTCTPVFILALFTVAKLWKQPRYSIMDESMKEKLYKHT
jgi:hypothetical protein